MGEISPMPRVYVSAQIVSAWKPKSYTPFKIFLVPPSPHPLMDYKALSPSEVKGKQHNCNKKYFGMVFSDKLSERLKLKHFPNNFLKKSYASTKFVGEW